MTKEPKFVPKPGQIDYSNIRYAPVVNTVVTHGKKVLLMQRSAHMRLYPNYWNGGVSGFLDDDRDIEDKVREELREELGLKESAILSLTRGQVLLQDAPQYNKTWLVVPMLAKVKQETFKLDWEAQQAQWFRIEEIRNLDLLPGFEKVLGQFFPKAV